MKGRNWDVLALLLGLVIVSGCGSHRDKLPAVAASATPAAEATPAGPEAKIHISYAHPGDYLSSLAVTKYSGAQPLKTSQTKEGEATTVRFAGGVTVWQLGAEKSLLPSVPMIGPSESRYAPTQVKYGQMPAHFVASIPDPDSGPPEPLESDHYYVFAATRGSGSTSYEAVKVNGDGSLEAYMADPRAGSSYWLCCNLPADFAVSAPPQ